MGKTGIIIVIGCLFCISALVLAFVILPNMDSNTGSLGIRSLVLELPVSKVDLRHSGSGLKPFCMDNGKYMELEVVDGSKVFSSTDGNISSVTESSVVIKVSNDVYVEYTGMRDIGVLEGNYITKGESLGVSDGSVVGYGLLDTDSGLYLCPYTYLDGKGKGIVDTEMGYSEYGSSVCVCESVKR